MTNDSRYDAPRSPVADADSEATAISRPATVVVALAVMWLYLVISLAFMIAPVKFALQQGAGVFAAAYVAIMSFFGLSIAFALVMTGRGRNWARFLAAAMFLLILSSQAYGAFHLVRSPTPAQLLGILVPPLSQLTAIVLLFLPRSNAWFRSKR